MDDEFEFDGEVNVFAFAHTVGKLCEIGDKLQDETFKNMVHDAALVCLQRLVEPSKAADLHVITGRKQ
jgi:hypothetical protein|tara:strand:+ start:544 stop:747 length:204 start_codon:yes stop_codon:yes gene_type:complete